MAQVGPSTDEAAGQAEGALGRRGRASLRFGVDDVLLEGRAFAQRARGRASRHAARQPLCAVAAQREWEFRAGARIDGSGQHGGAQPTTSGGPT